MPVTFPLRLLFYGAALGMHGTCVVSESQSHPLWRSEFGQEQDSQALRSGPVGEQGYLGARSPRLSYYINTESIIRLKERCNNPSAICTVGYFDVSHIWKAHFYYSN